MNVKKHPVLVIITLAIVLLIGAVFVYLQNTNPADDRGTISGNVVDSADSSSLKGVTVTAIDQDGVRYINHENTDTTGDDGYFIVELPPNDYTLLFSADGYQPFESSASYTVKKGEDLEIDEAFRLTALSAENMSASSEIPSTQTSTQVVPVSTTTAPAPETAPAQVMTEYTVRCLDTNGNLLSSTLDQGAVGSTIVATAPNIPDHLPQVQQQTLLLTDNSSDNVVTFYYDSTVPASASAIPSDALKYNGHSYYVYREPTVSVSSFWEAEAYCENLGGHLAVITDDELNQALYNYVFYSMGYKSAYFGLTDDDSEDNWYWVTGAQYSYEKWGPGQPDDKNNEDFALFYYEDKPYTWNDGDFGPDAGGYVNFLIEWDSY